MMIFDFWETEDVEPEFAARRPIEFDEIEIAEADKVDMALLAARVQAARQCGA